MNKTWNTDAPIDIQSENVLACPICKKKPQIVLWRKDEKTSWADGPCCIRAVMCVPCGYRGSCFTNEEIAIEKWNEKVRRKIKSGLKNF
jgi:C4-type Zn-finger protein